MIRVVMGAMLVGLLVLRAGATVGQPMPMAAGLRL